MTNDFHPPPPTLSTEDRAEWSIDVTGDDPSAKPERLFVAIDDSGLVEVDRCRVTSRKDSAKRFEGGSMPVGWITPDEHAWLADVLLAAILEQARRGWLRSR